MDRRKFPEYEIKRLRGRRAELLGWVRARTESEALDLAMEEYELEAWVRNRLVARRTE